MPRFTIFRRVFGMKGVGSRLSVVIAESQNKTKERCEFIIDAKIDSNSNSNSTGQENNSLSKIGEIEGKEFKLWCPVHSNGQGYITGHHDEEMDHFELFSSGTDNYAQALQLEPNAITGPEEQSYGVYLMHGDDKYYLCCNDDGSIVACKNTQKASFIINESQKDLHRSVLRIQGHVKRMLKVGSGDKITSTSINEKVDSGRFMDPACSFAIFLA